MYHIEIHLITRYMCKLDMTVYSAFIGYLFHPLISYCFDIVWCVLSCSSESIYKSESYRKVSGFPHMICLSFIGEEE
jgi:hypothetical protein